MKNQTQIALAVGAGYLLGRGRKMRLAIALGTAAATGNLGGLTGRLLGRGAKLMRSDGPLSNVSPEFAEITDLVRDELLSAGKAAALTAVRGRLDRISDRLHEQTQALREPIGDGQRAKRAAQRARPGALAAGDEDTGGEAAADYGEAEDYEDSGGEAAADYGEAEDYEDSGGEAADYEEDTEDQASDYDDQAEDGEDEEAYAEEEDQRQPGEPASGREDDGASRAEAAVGRPGANGETRRRRRAAPVRRTGRRS